MGKEDGQGHRPSWGGVGAQSMQGIPLIPYTAEVVGILTESIIPKGDEWVRFLPQGQDYFIIFSF